MSAPLPIPRIPIAIRPATLDDVPFMDGLQKRHRGQLGWMPTAQLEGKVRLGHVLIAEGAADSGEPIADGQRAELSAMGYRPSAPVSVGYCIARDQYFKRDDVGIIYQLAVEPGRRRALVGAALVRATFARAAWGCRLFCCWCAQDIEANRFWESLGFVPLAFRTGGREKGPGGRPRVHVFWQARIRLGDASTPWWFPFQTGSGSMREDRIVLPIPPGTHWGDPMPVVLPGEARAAAALGHEGASAAGAAEAGAPEAGARPRLAAAATRGGPAEADQPKRKPKRAKRKSAAARRAEAKAARRAVIMQGALRFETEGPATPAAAGTAAAAMRARPRRQAGRGGAVAARATAKKNDPALAAAARELRDRWLERVNADPTAVSPAGKYELTLPPPARSRPATPAALLAAA